MLQSLTLTLNWKSHAPFIGKRMKGCECKWLNAEIKSEMNSRDQISRKEKDWTKHKKQRNKCNNLIEKTKASYHGNLIEENATNQKGFGIL